MRIDLPNGTSVTSDSSDVDRALSSHFRRDVRLAQVAPDDFTIDMYHPNGEGADPAGRKTKVVAQKLGSALSAELGMESAVAVTTRGSPVVQGLVSFTMAFAQRSIGEPQKLGADLLPTF